MLMQFTSWLLKIIDELPKILTNVRLRVPFFEVNVVVALEYIDEMHFFCGENYFCQKKGILSYIFLQNLQIVVFSYR